MPAAQGCDVQERGPLPGLGKVWTQPEEAGMSCQPFEELDKQFENWTATGETPGLAYAVLKDGRLVRARAFGVTDAKSSAPWRFDTICRLYSMTKTVATCGLMCLVEEGVVDLDDEVSKYIPAFEQERLEVVHDESASATSSSPANKKLNAAITLRHLLSHTSGIAYGAAVGLEPNGPAEESYQSLIKKVDAGEIADLAHWCTELAKIPLRFQPGERWEYSYGLDIIGRVIEIASNKKLDEFLKERILQPLGMNDTAFALPETQRHRLAAFYRRDEEDALNELDGVADSLFVHPRQQKIISAGGMLGSISGGLVSTLNDFVRLCLMIQGGGELDGIRILKSETIMRMSSNLLPDEAWCLQTPGLGFSLLGSVAVPHADANWRDVPGEIGWGGLAGTAWAVDFHDKLVVVSFCQVMYELVIDEELREAVRKSLGQFQEAAVGNLLCTNADGERISPMQATCEEKPSDKSMSPEREKDCVVGNPVLDESALTPPAAKRLCTSMAGGESPWSSVPKKMREDIHVGFDGEAKDTAEVGA